MRAAYYCDKGKAREVLRIGEVPAPDPGPGEVRVRLACSGINPSDVRIRSGIYLRPFEYSMTIPHSDGAGVIDKVGRGISPVRVGERVWTFNAQHQRPFGTAAEYVVLPTAQAVPLPDGADFALGACLGVPALTAYYGVTLFGPVEGRSFLITGGAGTVGHFSVQIAKAMGAIVIATVSTNEKAAHARSAGADHVINYKTEDVSKRIKMITCSEGVDRVVEVNISANGSSYGEILAPRSMVAVYGSGGETTNLPARAFIGLMPTIAFYNAYHLNADPSRCAVGEIVGMIQAGRLRHTIAKRYAMDDIAAGHELVESGAAIGKVVIDIASLE